MTSARLLQEQLAFLGAPEICRAARWRCQKPAPAAGAGDPESPRVGVPGAWRPGAGGGGRSLQLRSSPGELWPCGPRSPAPSPASRARRAGRSGRVRPSGFCPVRASPHTSDPACRSQERPATSQIGGVPGVRPTFYPREASGGCPHPGPRPEEGHWRSPGPGPLLTAEPLSPCPGCPWSRPRSWSRFP